MAKIFLSENTGLIKNIKTGRPAITIKIKQMILKMKNDNILWGSRRIAGELQKIGIDLHHTTVHRIIQTFRKMARSNPQEAGINS